MNPVHRIAHHIPSWPLSRWLTYVVLFWAFFFLAATTYSLTWPFKTSVVESPVKVLTPTVHPGDHLQLQVSYCKYRSGPVRVERQIIDGILYSMAPTTSNFPTGCHSVVVGVQIPENLLPGEYRIQYTSVFRINALREIRVPYETEPFTIAGDVDQP